MPTNYATTDYIVLSAFDDGTTLSWSLVTEFPNSSNIIDQNDDNNLDIDIDNFGDTTFDFTGYYYTGSNGLTYPVFQSDTSITTFIIPYNSVDFDVFADIASSGSLTDKSDNFVPTGVPVCFGADSLIATPNGETAVEDLRIGELILTADGKTVPVKWIGRQTVHKLFAGPRMQPVRIRVGALGGELPHSDLTVTADHGLIIDDLVINASALVNGATINFVPLAELPDRVTYYHIETEAHDVILANGAPAETFVDNVGRQAFDNYGEYLDLYGADRIIPEMDRPRISSQRLLPDAIRSRLEIADVTDDFELSLTA